MSSSHPAVPVAARRQGGVFTAAQARSEGWSARTVRRRIVAHRWVYVAGRGLAEPRPEWTAWQLAVAARLSIPTAVISHRTAAGLHGFPDHFPGGPARDCEVILGSRRRPLPGISPHFVRLDESQTCVRPLGIRITSPVRTALDCLSAVSLGAALDLWAWLATRQVLDADGLRAGIAARPHWYGIQQLRRLLEVVAGGAVSQAEFRLHELLRTAGIVGWIANSPITEATDRTIVADVLFPGLKVAIEVDGWAAHSSRTSFVNDRRRQNCLVGLGYTVLRFTWDDLTTRPAEVIADIRRTLDRAVDPSSVA